MRLLALLFCVFALPAFGACNGTDLRPALSPAENERVSALLADWPYATGNHWKATRGDDVLNIVGTMHLDDPRFDAVTQRLAPVIDAAAVVLLELTAREKAELEASLAANPELLILHETSLPDLMGENWEPLAKAIQARGVPPFMAAKFQPWYLSMLLAVPGCMDLQAVTDQGLDMRIETRADAQGVPTRALESHDTIFRAFGSVPLDLQALMLRAALVPDAAADDLFATLLASYFDEEHALTWAMSEVLSTRFDILTEDETDAVFATMNDVLLTRRNHAWIPEILRALDETQGPVLAAFGAAHLGGPDGVLALLEAEGFELTPQRF